MNQNVRGASIEELKFTLPLVNLFSTHASRNLSNDCLDFIVNLLQRFLQGLARDGSRDILRVVLIASGTNIVVVHRNIELPSLQRLSTVDSCNDNNKLLHIAAQQPFLDLAHDVVQIFEQAIVSCGQDGQSILLRALKRFGLVDSYVSEMKEA